MDVIAAISNYVTKMVSTDGAGGSPGKMKIFLLDSETVCSIDSFRKAMPY
jgi:vacuolar protein sorting-associated protein 45